MTVVVTSETGGTAQPVGVAYVPPGRQDLAAGSSTALADAGVNAAVVADVFSYRCAIRPTCGVAR